MEFMPSLTPIGTNRNEIKVEENSVNSSASNAEPELANFKLKQNFLDEES